MVWSSQRNQLLFCELFNSMFVNRLGLSSCDFHIHTLSTSLSPFLSLSLFPPIYLPNHPYNNLLFYFVILSIYVYFIFHFCYILVNSAPFNVFLSVSLSIPLSAQTPTPSDFQLMSVGHDKDGTCITL